jgi:hypothetical protein
MFDAQAKSRDPWSWASMHRVALAGAALAVAAGAGAVLGRRRS